MEALSLRNQFLHAQVLPACGAGLARLDWVAGGAAQHVMRPYDGSAPPTTSKLACFPLLPWSNRMGGAGFTFEGQAYQVPPNRAGEPCPIHGDGWQYAWEVASHRSDALALTLDRSVGDPFSYVAKLDYVLCSDALHITLEVRNAGRRAMPFGLGLHPWLPRTADVRLLAPACGTWQRGADGLPASAMAIPPAWDFAQARALPADGIDNMFSGWAGAAEIVWPERGLRLSINANMDYYIVYAPTGADFFCFEPVDHAVNAFNLAGGPARHGMTVLAPGEVMRRRVAFRAGAA
ncbi:MAG: aldose 1-epimerase [Pseudomonadota bacterium]